MAQRTRLVATNQIEHVLHADVHSLCVMHPRAGSPRGITQIAGRAAGASVHDIVDALDVLGVAIPADSVEKALRCESAAAQAAAAVDSAATSEEVSAVVGSKGRERRVGAALVMEEERETGKVSYKVYVKYLLAVGGWPVAVILLCIQTAWQLFQVGSDFFLSSWTEQAPDEQERQAGRSLGIYAILCLGSALMVLARTLIVSGTGLRGARALFLWQTEAVIRSPMRFFDATPVGRILNRATEVSNYCCEHGSF